MNTREHTTGFYLEALLLIVVFIGMILVLTRIFGLGKSESGRAELLTNAVTLAGNAAEAASVSTDLEELFGILNENENAVVTDPSSLSVRYTRNMQADPNGPIEVAIGWYPEESDSGALVTVPISVFYHDQETPVYSLETAVFIPADGEGADA